MAEILVKFDEPMKAPSGDAYFAEAAGREVEGGLWEGWLEFVPVSDDLPTLESGRETTQPNRRNLEYWAQGLTRVYLEGALARALSQDAAQPINSTSSESAAYTSPANRGEPPNPRPAPVSAHPILDPFEVYSQGEAILRGELSALSRDHLEAIASAYNFNVDTRRSDTASRGNAEIVDAIVEGVRNSL